MTTNKAGTEVAISVDQSLLIKVLDAEGLEAAQMTLTVDWVIATVTPPGPDPEPPPGEDIIEQTYTPEAFNGDVVAMGKAIIADQEAAGDGALRAVIQWQRGKTYEYTDNHFLTGVQRYRCEATGQGDRPKLRNSNRNAGFWVDRGPICMGKGANCWTEPVDKNHAMALIETGYVGEMSVKLQNAGDGGRLKPGRWHAVFSYAQQIGGYPPNCRWIDYVIVDAVDGTTVMLDRPLAHNHFSDYWEDPNDVQSLGRARIGLVDGAYNDIRCTLEGTWIGIEFVGEDQAGMDTTLTESHIETLFEDCILSNPWPSMSKQVKFLNCILTGAGDQAAEPDKLSEEIVFDGVTQKNLKQYVQAASGYERFIIRNSNLNCFYISPRYLTIEDSILDSHGDTKFYVPCSWSYNGPILEATFTNVDIRATTAAQPTWAYSQAPESPLTLSGSSWQGNKLIIPRSFGGFESWLTWLYEGAMVFTGARVFSPGNYGRVDKIYAPADGSALWCDVTWIKGNKPTSGKLNVMRHGLRKLVWNNTRISVGEWIEPDFIAMDGTPDGARDFPAGID